MGVVLCPQTSSTSPMWRCSLTSQVFIASDVCLPAPVCLVIILYDVIYCKVFNLMARFKIPTYRFFYSKTSCAVSAFRFLSECCTDRGPTGPVPDRSSTCHRVRVRTKLEASGGNDEFARPNPFVGKRLALYHCMSVSSKMLSIRCYSKRFYSTYT